jgi:hypothetical protein
VGRTPPGRRCYIVKLEWPILKPCLTIEHAAEEHTPKRIGMP